MSGDTVTLPVSGVLNYISIGTQSGLIDELNNARSTSGYSPVPSTLNRTYRTPLRGIIIETQEAANCPYILLKAQCLDKGKRSAASVT